MISKLIKNFSNASPILAKSKHMVRFPTNDPHSPLHSLVSAYSHRHSGKHYRNLDSNKDIIPVINFMKNIGMSQPMLNHIYKEYPLALAIRSTHNDIFQLQTLFKNILGDKYSDHVLKQALFKHPRLLQFSNEQLTNLFEKIKKTLNPSQINLANILLTYPKVISPQLQKQLTGTATVYRDYLKLLGWEFSNLWSKQPFIITVPPKQVLGSLRIMLNKGFTQKQLVEILGQSGELSTIKYSTLRYNLVILKNYFGLKRQQLVNTIMNNQRLLIICPSAATLPKIKMFEEEFGLEKEYQQFMMKTNPRIYIKSKNSSQNKLKYLQIRFGIEDLKEMTEMPAILNYNYTEVIRPRGEAMLQTGNKKEWKDILNLTDDQFCKEIGMEKEEFIALKESMPVNFELDIKKRFFTKTMHSRRRIQY